MLMLFALPRIPAVQERLAVIACQQIRDALGARTEIGRVELRLPNRIIIDDVMIYDQQSKEMLSVPRLSAAIDLMDLLDGRIIITSAQLFGMRATLYQRNAHSPLNCQFVIDSLAPKKDEPSKPIDLSISSLIIRNSGITYNRQDVPLPRNAFSASHISVSRLSSHIILNRLTDNNLNVTLKRLSMKEDSGLEVKDLSFMLSADISNGIGDATIKNLHLEMPNTRVEVPSFVYKKKGGYVEGTLEAPYISFSDFSPLIAAYVKGDLPDDTLYPMSLLLSLQGNTKKASSTFALNSVDTSDLAVQGSCDVYNIEGKEPFGMELLLSKLHTSEKMMSRIASVVELPKQLRNAGSIDAQGRVSMKDRSHIKANLDVKTLRAGNATVDGMLNGGNIQAHVKGNDVDLATILENKSLGKVTCNLDIDAILHDGKKLTKAAAKGELKSFAYSGQTFNDATIDATYNGNSIVGTLNVNDKNVRFDANANLRNINDYDNLDGELNIKNIYLGTLFGKTYDASLDEVIMNTDRGDKGEKILSLRTDFADITMKGNMKLSTIPQSFINLMASQLPYLPGLPKIKPTYNNFYINAEVKDLKFVKKLVDIPVGIDRPVSLHGYMNDDARSADLTLNAPAISIANTNLSDLSLWLGTPSGKLESKLSTILLGSRATTYIGLQCAAEDNMLSSILSWENSLDDNFKGELNVNTHFEQDLKGRTMARVSVPDSQFEVGDLAWTIHSDGIMYDQGRLMVDNFSIGNETQSITINGVAGPEDTDSITADLKNVNVAYILDLVKFHSVDFSGMATGHAVAYNVMKNLNGSAQLSVEDFRFEKGRLGTLSIDANYTDEKGDIDIVAEAVDREGYGRTGITGFVSPKRSELSLNVKAEDTRLECVQTFCSSFMSDVNVRGNGDVHIAGPFKAINITGYLVPEGSLTISSIGCRYALPGGDTIRFVPDDIQFNKLQLIDKDGNTATIDGDVHHTHLTNIGYDLTATTSERFLAFDFPVLKTDETFCGVAYIKGKVGIHGSGNELNINADAKALNGSRIVYDASSPDAITSQDFITWGSVTESRHHGDTLRFTGIMPKIENEKVNSTHIRLSFMVDVEPTAYLHLVMDRNTGDYVDLYGAGELRIGYYNKGGLDIFGNYVVERGTYKMTIQNLLRRDFTFQKGGTIIFGGDPYDAVLNVKAIYALNSVSLADLNVGTSFTTNNVPVNCIMTITGTPGHPHVAFGMDLPSLSAEARQMIYSLINSEEEMNQQVLYLLGVGRFYSQQNNNAETTQRVGQTTLAMQSILSGTLTQQFSNIMSEVLGSRNWTFGANITPGNEGYNNTEYEGLLSGRLFNNRLVFNSQFGYRDNVTTNKQTFIGDFDIRYLLTPSGTISVNIYNKANDRYFTRSSLNTQGIGITFQKEFGK
jgi:hypothetical protein